MFERVAARLEELVVPVRQRYGLTQKKIEELQRAMIAKARGDGKPSVAPEHMDAQTYIDAPSSVFRSVAS